jgi:lactate dehydrogenase-like 2-hydroxyacid dehydrogenase
MTVAFFDTHRFDRAAFEEANRRFGHDLVFFEPRLTTDTAVLATGCRAVCSFVNDRLDADALEEGVFFEDLSGRVLQDDVLARLLTFPNTLITSHQGFLTAEALANIADTTVASIRAFERREPLAHRVEAPPASSRRP